MHAERTSECTRCIDEAKRFGLFESELHENTLPEPQGGSDILNGVLQLRIGLVHASLFIDGQFQFPRAFLWPVMK